MRQIITDDTLAYSEAFIFVMDNFVRILKAGHAEHSLCINNSMYVTYAKEGDKVIGACVYDMDMDKRQAIIYSAGVDKAYQNSGVYQEIYTEVEETCYRHGMRVLNSNIHIENQAMLASAVKNGRKLEYFRTTKRL